MVEGRVYVYAGPSGKTFAPLQHFGGEAGSELNGSTEPQEP